MLPTFDEEDYEWSGYVWIRSLNMRYVADTFRCVRTTGEYLSTTHAFFGDLKDIMKMIHMAQTASMMDLIILVAGEEFEKHIASAPKLRTLWNEYCTEPWNCWCIGLYVDTPLNISNNQPIESWHNHGVRRLLRKALRGSTATVLNFSLPKIVYQDSIKAYRDRTTCNHCIHPRHALHISMRTMTYQ